MLIIGPLWELLEVYRNKLTKYIISGSVCPSYCHILIAYTSNNLNYMYKAICRCPKDHHQLGD